VTEAIRLIGTERPDAADRWVRAIEILLAAEAMAPTEDLSGQSNDEAPSE
jgi:hypothetical protein